MAGGSVMMWGLGNGIGQIEKEPGGAEDLRVQAYLEGQVGRTCRRWDLACEGTT